MQCQRRIVITILTVLFTMAPSWAQSASTLLQNGIFTEETVGDLDAAIKIYEQIVADAEKNRAFAAQAHKTTVARATTMGWIGAIRFMATSFHRARCVLDT